MWPTLRYFSVPVFLSLEATGPAAGPLQAPDSTGQDDLVVSYPKILERSLSAFQLPAWGLHYFPGPEAPQGCARVPHVQALG